MDINKLLTELTLEEKAGLCSGADAWRTKAVDRLGIPAVMMTDGPHGLRKQKSADVGQNDTIEAVCFPTASALASSFDTDLVYEVGSALGNECQAEGISMLLGPGLNIKRSPLCGRNFEYFSEDPVVAGKIAAAFIKGLQSQGVLSCAKHFAANNQETRRVSVSAEADERTLHEIYLKGFEEVVKDAKVGSIMCSYNRINGKYSSENKWLLTDVLRDKWGYDGFVVTDWGAVKDRVVGLLSGLDLEMPGPDPIRDKAIVDAVNDGSLPLEVLDTAVRNILVYIDKYLANQKDAIWDKAADSALAVKAAANSAVLLKNDGQLLPLKASQKVAFIGEFADKPRFQGAGSSFIKVPVMHSALSYVKNVTYAKGFHAMSDESDEALVKEAVALAKASDVAVLFVGLPDSYESEGFDRADMKMPPSQLRLIKEVCAVNQNVAIVLHAGSPVEMPFAPNVRAILDMHLGGEGVGIAAAKLLYGEENPSGKLAETYPIQLEDNPSYLTFPGGRGVVPYSEGVFVGYRYYDKKKYEVRFPFGHGLSYTDFQYSDLSVSGLDVSVTVKNTGSFAGAEVIQLYVRNAKSTVARPIRELKAFQKIFLQPGQSATVTFSLTKRDFCYWEARFKDWFADSGLYGIEIGSSSRDIRLSSEIQINSTPETAQEYSADTMVGELEWCAKGRAYMEKIIKLLYEKRGEDDALAAAQMGAGAEKMIRSFMLDIPLKNLIDEGVLTQMELADMIADLQ